MGEANGASTDQPAYKGSQAPCVYCGRILDRGSDRCPHCRTSYSFAVRKASREVVGDWFYLDSRNPSGRGVTFETLIKMIEKGRIKPDSVVRGPTTHQDWTYAAEAPRLAKYLGLCPHCFAEAKPEATYCATCQLNMNERPADARPGATPDEIGDPFHKPTYEMEERLAEAARAAREPQTPPPAPPAPAPAASGAGRPASKAEAKPSATAAAAAALLAGSGSDRPSRVAPVPQRGRPKLWLVLLLTWVTLIPILLVLAYAVPGFPLHNTLHSAFGGEEEASPEPPPAQPAKVDPQWIQRKLAQADAAEQEKDYEAAIAIFEEIIRKTGQESYRSRIETLRKKPAEQRQARLATLGKRLEMAEKLQSQGRYEDALAILRNLGKNERALLASVGVGVDKMEESILAARDKVRQQQKRKQDLADRLAAAKALREEGKLKEALSAYVAVGNQFDANLVAQQIDLGQTIQDLEAQIAAAEPKPTEPPPSEPEPSPEVAAKQIADRMTQAADLEQKEQFDEALALLEGIKDDFPQKFWPDKLEQRIRQVKAKQEALKFFGMDEEK